MEAVMSEGFENGIDSFFTEVLIGGLALPYIQKAEEQGYPQIAKLFRALVASENVRQHLLRVNLPNHTQASFDYFVCPECSLIFAEEAPETCPVDNTPGGKFERIS